MQEGDGVMETASGMTWGGSDCCVMMEASAQQHSRAPEKAREDHRRCQRDRRLANTLISDFKPRPPFRNSQFSVVCSHPGFNFLPCLGN